jgi:hypothetical protein
VTQDAETGAISPIRPQARQNVPPELCSQHVTIVNVPMGEPVLPVRLGPVTYWYATGSSLPAASLDDHFQHPHSI